MVSFADFDGRGYRSVDVRTGYREWVPTYEQTVEHEMDIVLLDALTTPTWPTLRFAADLGCGTGRTGAWLREHGVDVIDGVDVTPEMLAVAHEKRVYRSLTEANAARTGLEDAAYDVVTICLVDEHLPDLRPLYNESWRLAKPAGICVVVGYHPHFMMAAGMPTHFTSGSGEPIAIDTHVHLLSEHVSAALKAGWVLVEMREKTIDDKWLRLKPKWEQWRNHPISFAMVWSKSA